MTNSPTEPSDAEIEQCAYLIWEAEGRPEGREREHWAQAAEQLRAMRAHDGWVFGGQNNDGDSPASFRT